MRSMNDEILILGSSSDTPEEESPQLASTQERPSFVEVWLLAIRPRTLWAAFVPVAIGTAIAVDDEAVHWISAILALFGAAAIQIGTNLVNDYSDFRKGADTDQRKGPIRVTQSGLLRPRAVLGGAVVAFAFALAVGGYLIYRGGLPILTIGLVSIAAGILYTAGPKPLAYMGLGDIFVLVFFGPIAVAGAHYVQSLSWSWTAAAAGLGPGLLSVAMLSVNNLRDIEEDRQAGKRTLAVRFGTQFARWEYVGCIVAAGVVPVALYLSTGAHVWSLLAGGALLLALPTFGRVLSGISGQDLNPLLGFTGRLSIAYAIVFSFTWQI